MIIINGSNSTALARAVARKLSASYSFLTVNQFPDGDLYVKFNTDVKGKNVVMIRSFYPNPNQSLLEVIFAAETAKELGAKKFILVAPYLGFMRQDKRFHPGEAVSSRIMAQLLNRCVNRIITVDPHLHRYRTLKKIFTIPATKITANTIIADYIKKQYRHAVITGPDGESSQWAKVIADSIGFDSIILQKHRTHARKVRVEMVSDVSVQGKEVIIIDDIISTGHTVAEAAKLLKKKGAKRVSVIGVHGLFVENAVEKLRKAGITSIISTNTITHPTNKIDVSELIVSQLKK